MIQRVSGASIGLLLAVTICWRDRRQKLKGEPSLSAPTETHNLSFREEWRHCHCSSWCCPLLAKGGNHSAHGLQCDGSPSLHLFFYSLSHPGTEQDWKFLYSTGLSFGCRKQLEPYRFCFPMGNG
jgi:hypothetical protein